MKVKFGFVPVGGAKSFQAALNEVCLAEKLGFDSAWVQERHLQQNHTWSAPLVAAMGFVTHTSRLLIGTDILVYPFYHPMRLAEEVALLDIISKGRFVFGTAIGYRSDEFAFYGAPLERRGTRFEEGLKLMKTLWVEDTSTFRGEYYTVENVRFEPKPFSRPHPPIWVGGYGPLMIRRAALIGDAWIPGSVLDLSDLLERKRSILEHRSIAGLPPRSEWPLTRDVIIANTNEEARELANRHILSFYRNQYLNYQHPTVKSDVVADLDTLVKERCIVGNPDEVAVGVRFFIEKYGATHLICRFSVGGMPHEYVLKELKLFAQEVMPLFKH